MLSAPDITGSLAAIARRGRVVVVDPRRTETAQRATEWVPIRPGTDALLLFGILHTLAENGWVRSPEHSARQGDRPRRGRRASGIVPAGAGGRRDGDRRAHHPSDGAGTGVRREPGPVQPNRRVHAGVRHARNMVGVRRQHGPRRPRPARRCGVPETARMVADVHEAAGPASRRLDLRPLPQPGSWGAGGVRPVPDQLPGRRDRYARRWSDSGVDHHRGQPGHLRARCTQTRICARISRRHDLRRQLAQRDHSTRRRHPARTLAAWSVRTPTTCIGRIPLRRASSGRIRCSTDRPAHRVGAAAASRRIGVRHTDSRGRRGRARRSLRRRNDRHPLRASRTVH